MVSFQGDFDQFAVAFPNALVPRVIRFMLDEWANVQQPDGDPLENRITNRFVGHLQRVMRKYDFPCFKFTYRPKLASPDADFETGELDIEVSSFSCHPDAFFIVECKRLNVQSESGFKSLAAEYVGRDGMGCFVSGQYRCGGSVGGMLGYVMTRAVDDAIKSINRQLEGQKDALCLHEPFELRESDIIPHEPRVKQTTHSISDREFEIVHLFVEFSPRAR